MNKYYLILGGVGGVIVLLAGYFGITILNRNRILDSGKVVLLINKNLDAYSFSDFLPREEITRGWKIKGFYDQMTEDQWRQKVEGLGLIVGVEVGKSDNRIPVIDSAPAKTPKANELEPWQEALATLTAEQREVCGRVPFADYSQFCLSDHLVFNALQQKRGGEVCEPIFDEQQKKKCVQIIEQGDISVLADVDSNNIMDTYQVYSNKYDNGKLIDLMNPN